MKPLAPVQMVSEGSDRESLAIGRNAVFLEIMERLRIAHREQGGISPDEMRRHFGIRAKKRTRQRASR